jgi:hypothetical protein
MNNSVTCQICKQKMKDLTSHIFYKHGIKAEKYKSMFPNMPIRCESLLKQQSERIKGNKNPAYQHGGKYSPFSLNFINGIEKVEETKRKAKENKTRDRDNTQIEYWLKKTNGNLNEAQKLLSQRQSTFSLKSCIKKYGEENGTKIWLDRQEKWHKNYKKSNFSKISQELFWNIMKQLDVCDNIYFAQLNENKQKDDSGVNHEIVMKLNQMVIKPDFIDTKQKKIIEFDGEYWHGEVGHGNKEREEKKDRALIQQNYQVLRIGEKEYKNNKQGTVEKCLNFLKS